MKKCLYIIAAIVLVQPSFVSGMLRQELAKSRRKEKRLQDDLKRKQYLYSERQEIAREQKKRFILEKLISLNVGDDIAPEVFAIAKKERRKNITDDFLQKIINKKGQEKQREKEARKKRRRKKRRQIIGSTIGCGVGCVGAIPLNVIWILFLINIHYFERLAQIAYEPLEADPDSESREVHALICWSLTAIGAIVSFLPSLGMGAIGGALGDLAGNTLANRSQDEEAGGSQSDITDEEEEESTDDESDDITSSDVSDLTTSSDIASTTD